MPGARTATSAVSLHNATFHSRHGTQGGESEELLGRWRRSRGIGDEIVIATKVGARPLAPAADFVRSGGSLIEMNGLSAKAIREVGGAEHVASWCRAAGRGADETDLLQRAGLDSELTHWAAGTQLIRLVGPEEL